MNLLVAVDGSREANEALAYATDIAGAVGGSITIVHAIDPDVYETGGMEPITTLSDADQRLVLESVADAEDRGMAVIEDAETFAEELGYDVNSELLYGDPVSEITDYAEQTNVDAIIVGHRGYSERTERLLGSVAKNIVERATVPVTVVR